MNKRIIFIVFLMVMSLSFLSAEDQVYFEANAGLWWYPGIGGKVGWIHFWENEKIGLICDVSYLNVFGGEFEVRQYHRIGVAVGVIFNNMGSNGVFRTSEYIKLKGVFYDLFNPNIFPTLDIGIKLNMFFIEKIALTTGIGLEFLYVMPCPYLSLGMTFTL